MAYEEQDWLLLSGIQHFAFCRRQWALIHIEQQWQENLLTMEGRFLHEKVHGSEKEVRKGIVITRNLAVFSRELGVSGACDVVEFHRDPTGITLAGRERRFRPVPVEYKRGKPKEHDADMLQLCAQALCLEEMLVCNIREGHLFYGEPRRRQHVVFDQALRNRVSDMFQEMHELFQRGYTPKVRTSTKCRSCSLKEICVPRLLQKGSVEDWIKSRLQEDVQ